MKNPPPQAGRSELERIMRRMDRRATQQERGTAWIAPTFAINWINHASGNRLVGYRKVQSEVILRGIIRASAAQVANAAMFTLPAGYRPSLSEHFPAVASTGFVDLAVDSTTGGVFVTTAVASGVWISLSGASFYTD